MKGFFRKIPGKVLLYFMCVISALTLIASAVGAVYMLDLNAYTSSPEELYSEAATDKAYQDAYYLFCECIINSSPVENFPARYEIKDESGKVVAKSKESLKASPFVFENSFFKNEDSEVDFTSQTDSEKYTVTIEPKLDSSGLDYYRLIYKAVNVAYSLRYKIYAIAAAALIIYIISFIALICVSGRRAGTEEIVPGVFNKFPVDILTGILVIIPLVFWDGGDYISLIAAGIEAVFLFPGFVMCIATHIKQKNLLKSTLVSKIVRFGIKALIYFVKLIKNIPLIPKTAAVLLLIPVCMFGFILLDFDNPESFTVIWFIVYFFVAAFVMYEAIMLRKLQKSGEELAKGNLNHHTDTTYMLGNVKKHGDNLNSIAVGMNYAVNERLKSERTKSELITNVSHDIKTPLTSIINYSRLIGEEKTENSKINEYSDVLVRQSERLKRLLEDLIEVSKASSGSLEVNMEPCSASVFLLQSAGEYSDKLIGAGLELITSVPEEPLTILADGRRMQRIFDNLLTNICKYAQHGTRVYLSLEKQGNCANIIFRNISKTKIEQNAGELENRFVRGDNSRSGSGSGLGLSISKSLVELQGGTQQITVDGDLFKAVLSFPIV